MTDNKHQHVQEPQEDAVLRLLMEEYAEVEGEALWREFQAAEAAGNGPKILRREDRESSRGSTEPSRQKDFLKRLGKIGKRAASILLVLICLLSPLIMSVEAFKLPVLNYIVALEKKFSGFNFGKNDALSEEQEALVDLIITAPCPDEHTFSHYQVTSDGKIWIYFNHNNKIAMKMSLYPSAGQINIDTENASQISMKVQDYEAVYLKKDGHRLMWMDPVRKLVFDIHAYELEEEAFWRYTHRLAAYLSK